MEYACTLRLRAGNVPLGVEIDAQVAPIGANACSGHGDKALVCDTSMGMCGPSIHLMAESTYFALLSRKLVAVPGTTRR
jgi:hypothetical protein